MNAIVSKVPLISEAPIEGKWYDLGQAVGRASRQPQHQNTTTFNATDFNITDITQYKMFAIRIVDMDYYGAHITCFGSTPLGYSSTYTNCFVFGYPALKDDNIKYTRDYNSYVDFPANFTVGTGVVQYFDVTIQLLGMK